MRCGALGEPELARAWDRGLRLRVERVVLARVAHSHEPSAGLAMAMTERAQSRAHLARCSLPGASNGAESACPWPAGWPLARVLCVPPPPPEAILRRA